MSRQTRRDLSAPDVTVVAGVGQTLPVRFLQDGAFLTANLQPGTYELSLTIREAAPRLIEGFRIRDPNNLSPVRRVPGKPPRFITRGPRLFEWLDGDGAPKIFPGQWLWMGEAFSCPISLESGWS